MASCQAKSDKARWQL